MRLRTIIVALVSLSVSAQESSIPQQQEENTVEKIPVVGSRIRQLDLEGASPVKVIDREEIEKAAAHTVGGILQNSTLSPYGGDSSRIDVRGMGATRTLVLVNGKRLPKTGGSYGNRATNINAIPASAVERIEVLSDGASAVYGSEALASVINIVTRKNVDGVIVGVKPGLASVRGSEYINASVTWGKVFSAGNLSTSFDIDYSPTESFASDLDYYKPSVFRNPRFSDNYENFRVYNQAFPNCPEGDRNSKGECAWYHGDISRTSTAYKISNYTEFRRELGAGLTFTADLVGKYAQGSSYGPAYMRILLRDSEIPDGWDLANTLDYTPGARSAIRFTHRLRGYESGTISRIYNVGSNLGLSGDWGSGDWMWSINNNIGGYRESSTYENSVLIAETKKVFRDNRYNPFEGSEFSSVAGDIFYDVNHSNDYFLNILSGNIDGPIYEGPQASLSVASGVEWGYHKYREEGDPQASSGNVVDIRGANSSGSRNHRALYAELGANYSQWLESQLAVRLEKYSDFGTTLNPKLAVRLKPWNRLALRASVGTGFKAPELSESKGGQDLAGYVTLRDEVQCEAHKDADKETKKKYCDPDSFYVEAKPNPAIQEETSVSYNVGMVLEPLKALTVKLDYWHYRVEDIIGLPPIQHFLKLQSEGKNPNGEEYGIIDIVRDQEGDSDPNIDKIESLTVTNTGSSVTRGLDMALDYRFSAKHSLMLDYSLMLENYFDLDSITTSTLGKQGLPRYRYKLIWDYTLPGDRHSFRAERVTVGRYKNAYEDGIIPEHSQYNVSWSWNLSPSKGIIIVKANNLFNLHPRYDERQNIYFDTSLYRGQSSYSVQYRVTF